MLIREIQTAYRVREVADDQITGREATSPRAVAALLAAYPARAGARLDLQPVEVFGALLLNTKHRIIAADIVSIGTLDATIVHPRDIFRSAIRTNAAALVLFHNHPSGDPEPSADDVSLTRRLIAAGALLGIPLLDHVIIGHDGRYASLKERGIV